MNKTIIYSSFVITIKFIAFFAKFHFVTEMQHNCIIVFNINTERKTHEKYTHTHYHDENLQVERSHANYLQIVSERPSNACALNQFNVSNWNSIIFFHSIKEAHTQYAETCPINIAFTSTRYETRLLKGTSFIFKRFNYIKRKRLWSKI